MNKEFTKSSPEERVIIYFNNYNSWIDKAIYLEESKCLENAIHSYIKGLEFANRCLEENVNGFNDKQIEAKHIQSGLKLLRQSAINRLEYLYANLEKKKLSENKKENSDGVISNKKKAYKAKCLNSDTMEENNFTGSHGKSLKSSLKHQRTEEPEKPISCNNRPTPSYFEVKKITNETLTIDKETIFQTLQDIDKPSLDIIEKDFFENSTVKLDDIAVNESNRKCILENIIYPIRRPELFTGLREPAKTILLYGPPGNGKSLMAKAIAYETKSHFFNINLPGLMFRIVNDNDQIIRLLFTIAKNVNKSVIFLDDVDCLLSTINTDDKYVSYKIFTKFLHEIDEIIEGNERKVLIIAATNKPYELDDLILRRFHKKIYIKIPDKKSRKFLLKKLLSNQITKLNEKDIDIIIEKTVRYSCGDLILLVKAAAMIPIKELSLKDIQSVNTVRTLEIRDFLVALEGINPSVAVTSIMRYDNWHLRFNDHL